MDLADLRQQIDNIETELREQGATHLETDYAHPDFSDDRKLCITGYREETDAEREARERTARRQDQVRLQFLRDEAARVEERLKA